MKLVKMNFKPIVSFFKFVATPHPDYHNNLNKRTGNKYETKINHATGLPIIGSLDSLVHSIGTSASDRNTNCHNDYHRQNSSYSSSYDPFTNRY